LLQGFLVVDVLGDGMDALVRGDFLNGTQQGGRGAVAAKVAGQAAAEHHMAGVNAAQVAERG